jgi:hypothetical protein
MRGSTVGATQPVQKSTKYSTNDEMFYTSTLYVT